MKSINYYRINKQAQRNKKIKENILIVAGVVLFFSVIGIIGHYEYNDILKINNITVNN